MLVVCAFGQLSYSLLSDMQMYEWHGIVGTLGLKPTQRQRRFGLSDTLQLIVGLEPGPVLLQMIGYGTVNGNLWKIIAEN